MSELKTPLFVLVVGHEGVPTRRFDPRRQCCQEATPLAQQTGVSLSSLPALQGLEESWRPA